MAYLWRPVPHACSLSLTGCRVPRYAGPVLTARELIAQDALRQISVGQWSRDPRRVDMSQRLRIDREDFHDLSAEWIRDRYDTPEVSQALCKFIDPSANLLQRITDRLAVAYRQPPTRFIRDDEQASQNWAQLMKQARVHTVAKTWGRYSFLLNVCFVVPVVRPMMPWWMLRPHWLWQKS